MQNPIRRLCLWLAAALIITLLPLPERALAEDYAQDITGKCAFRVSEGDRGKLTNGNPRSTWSYSKKGAWVGIRLPEGVQASGILVEWLFDPTGVEIVEYDSAAAELRRRDQSCTFPNIVSWYDLLPETRYIQLVMTVKSQKICGVHVYSAGDTSKLQIWQPPVEKATLMVVSTHQDDELLFLGGTLPYYAVAKQCPTVMVYMANCNRLRRYEALNGLWVMGVRNYPDFINLEDQKLGSLKKSLELWGGTENVLKLLVERIRRYKPEVIVTQDLQGEYGHKQHIITATAMYYAIEAAADPERFPESYEQYGTWQVKKLYHHLYDQNTLTMDWNTPLDELGGLSPWQVAKLGYDQHASQHKYFTMKNGGEYDNAKFGLYYSYVGPDVEKNDFLEHIAWQEGDAAAESGEMVLADGSHPGALDDRIDDAISRHDTGDALIDGEEPEPDEEDEPFADAEDLTEDEADPSALDALFGDDGDVPEEDVLSQGDTPAGGENALAGELSEEDGVFVEDGAFAENSAAEDSASDGNSVSGEAIAPMPTETPADNASDVQAARGEMRLLIALAAAAAAALILLRVLGGRKKRRRKKK